MLSRKSIHHAQSFLRLTKSKLNTLKAFSNQPSPFLSLSKLNSTKLSQSTSFHLYSPFKFSFSSSSQGQEGETTSILKTFFEQWNNNKKNDLESLLQKATQAYEKQSLEGKSTTEDKIGLNLARAFLAFDSQNFEESLRLYEEISEDLANTKECCFAHLFPKAYFQMGKLYFMKGKEEQGYEFCNQSLKSAESNSKNEIIKANHYYENAELLHDNKQRKIALYSAIKAYELLLKELGTGNPYAARIDSLLTKLCSDLSEYQNSLKGFKELVDLVQKSSPEKTIIATAYVTMSAVHLADNLGDYALIYFEKFKKLLNKVQDTDRLLMMMALYSWTMKLDGSNASPAAIMKSLQEIIELNRNPLDHYADFEGFLLYSLGKVQIRLSMFTEAKETYEACEVAMKNYPQLLAGKEFEIYYYQGLIATMQNEFARGLQLYEKVLQMPNVTGEYIGNCYNNMAASYLKMGDLKKTEENFVKALETKKNDFGLQHPHTRHYLQIVVDFLKKYELLDKAKQLEKEYSLDAVNE